jgi:hypothetical protein
MIVELRDHRDVGPQETLVPERIVLWPNDEVFYNEIVLASAKEPGKWTDLDALKYEASELVSTGHHWFCINLN